MKSKNIWGFPSIFPSCWFTFPFNVFCRLSILAIVWLWESSLTVTFNVTSLNPSNDTLPLQSDPKVIVLAVASLVAAAAVPVTDRYWVVS